jgi:hypothetical protein
MKSQHVPRTNCLNHGVQLTKTASVPISFVSTKGFTPELRAKGEPVIWGKASDLSQGGCFIEMPIPLHNGISFDIALWLGEAKLHLQGQVVSVQPGFGNGVRFLALTSEHQAHLRQFLETLSPSEAAGNIAY